MKKLLAILLALCMLLSLAACGAKPADPTDPPVVENNDPVEENPTEEPAPEPVTIRFWQAGGDTAGAAELMRTLLDKFEEQNPGIKVDYQAIPWSNDPETQFQTAIAAGDCADILSLGDSKAFIIAGEGGFLPLDDMLTEETKADMSEIMRASCVYGGSNADYAGKMMYVAWYYGTRPIVYNKEIFDFFGVDYPTEKMTHAELLELAKKVTGEMNGKQVYGYGTRATTSEQYIHFMWNYGAQIIDINNKKAATDSEAWKKGTEDYLAFYEAGVVPPGAVNMSGDELFAMFNNGEIAMYVAAIDYPRTQVQADPAWADKIGVAPLVGQDYSYSYTGADVMAVSSTTKHPEEAAKLLNYLLSAEPQAAYCENVGFSPVSKAAAEAPFFSEDVIQAGYAATLDGLHFFGNYGVGTGTPLKEHMQMLLNGEYESVEAYQEGLTAQLNAAILEMGWE